MHHGVKRGFALSKFVYSVSSAVARADCADIVQLVSPRFYRFQSKSIYILNLIIAIWSIGSFPQMSSLTLANMFDKIDNAGKSDYDDVRCKKR